MKKHWHPLKAILIGAAITPFAAGAAVASAGAGHGSYALAKLLFPYGMLLTRISGDTITNPLIALALVQFPLYGLVVASFNPMKAICALLLLHEISTGLCFSGFLPNF